jgi:hypothetical protein
MVLLTRCMHRLVPIIIWTVYGNFRSEQIMFYELTVMTLREMPSRFEGFQLPETQF